MSRRKSKRRNARYTNPYRTLADSVKEINKVIMPSVEPTRASFKVLSDGVSRAAKGVAVLCPSDNFSKELVIMANEISKPLKGYLDSNITTSYDSLKSMIELVSDIHTEQIEKIREIDFSKIFSSMSISSETCSLKNLKDVVDATYKSVQEGEGENLEVDDVLSTEEIEEAINEQISNPKGFQERAKEWSEKKIVKYFIIWEVICFLYSNFLQPYFQQNVGVPVTAWVVSNVKELPQKGAEVICQIKEGVEAVIIENTNYYYKVSFTDENGVKQEGYVAKKNLKLIEQNEEVTEESEKIEEDKVDEK